MKNTHIALIIDDEPDILELLEMTLSRMGVESVSAADLSTAKGLINNRSFDLCLTDMRLPDGDGVEFISYVQQHCPTMPIAVITAHGNMETAIQALKLGAFDFLSKPIDINLLRALVKSALKLSQDNPSQTSQKLIGNSGEMHDLRKKISKLARSQAPIYISGESGTGKELVARMIHEQGPRAGRAFVPVNCGAIPYDLMESEFFGHKKGSFTGAVSDKDGFFQVAEGGTLFLDEVAELPASMQVKLLRALQEKTIRPVGLQQELTVDVRILSATHKELETLVKEGKFRQDLYYRINVIEIHVPPLRERTEDMILLVEHILQKISKQAQMEKMELSDNALAALSTYHFPGNIRELENILERAMTLCEGKVIEESDLVLESKGEEVIEEIDEELPLDQYLVSTEKRIILNALKKNKWNKTAAAKTLGVSFRTLRYRLQKLGID